MRIVITGATGNVGTSVLAALAGDDRVESIVGLARRRPSGAFPKTTWATGDVAETDLPDVLQGADAVVHLAWAIQPSREAQALERTNVAGSRRVFLAAAEAKVGTLVYASSVGAYSPGPQDRSVTEEWPTEGVDTSFYSRHKAEVERMLTAFEADHPSARVVRLRPALTFKREAAAEIRRYFAGPFLPNALIRRRMIPFVPDVRGLRFQAVHSSDVGEAYRLAITSDVRGPFNIAADPILDTRTVARLLGARPMRIPPGLLRGGAGVTWRLHLHPTPPGWVDMALQAPVMDTTRARTELGWTPRHTSEEALLDLLAGLGDGTGFPTPPLDERAGGRVRLRELVTGVGRT